MCVCHCLHAPYPLPQLSLSFLLALKVSLAQSSCHRLADFDVQFKSTTARGCPTIKSTVDACEGSPTDFFKLLFTLSARRLCLRTLSIIHMIVSFEMGMAEEAQKSPKTNKENRQLARESHGVHVNCRQRLFASM